MGQQLRRDLVKACSSEPTSAGTRMHYSHQGLVRIKSQVVSSESFYCHILLLHPPFLFSEVTWQLSELFVSRNYHNPFSVLSAEQPPCEQIHLWPTHQPPRWPSPGHAGSFSPLVTQTQRTPVHVRTPRHQALTRCLQGMGVSCSFKSHELVHCLFDVPRSYCNANPSLDTSFLIYLSATITSAN